MKNDFGALLFVAYSALAVYVENAYTTNNHTN